MFKLFLWWFLSIGSLILAYKTGGTGSAAALIIHCIQPYMFPYEVKGTSEDFAKYQGIDWLCADARNPLYLKGYFREKCYDKSKRLLLSGLKGFWGHQIHTVIQLLIFGGYGIYCLFIDSKHHWLIEGIFACWLLTSLCMVSAIADYYKKILKSLLSTEDRDKQKWKPFAYENFGEKLSCDFKEYPELYQGINELESLFSGIGINIDEEFAVRKNVNDRGWMRMYTEAYGSNVIKMYALVYMPEIQEEDLNKLNSIFQEIVQRFLLGDEMIRPWQFIFILAVEKETVVFHNVLQHSVFQKEGLYRLPVGMSIEKKNVYIPIQNDSFGLKEYETMKEEVFELFK